MLSYAAVRSRKTAPVFSVFSSRSFKNVYRTEPHGRGWLTGAVSSDAVPGLGVRAVTRPAVVPWCWVVTTSTSTSRSFTTRRRTTSPARPERPLAVR